MSQESVFIGDHTVIKSLIYGPRILLDMRDNVNVNIALHGNWESWVTNHFMAVVKPGMTVLDIGAHCGYYSLLAAKLVGPLGKVYSFEPNPFYHYNFLRSMAINGYNHVTLNKVALSNRTGKMNILQFSEEGQDGPSISPFGIAFPHEYHETTVETGILLDYLPNKKVDIIKLDIDGGEPYIMESLFEIIDANLNIKLFMEYLPLLWRDQDPLPILQRFAGKGFRFKKLQWDGKAVETNIHILANYKEGFHIDLLLERT